MEEPRVVGDWKRISVLGSGGFGTVVLWRCSVTNDSIAVKKCKIQCPANLSAKQKERWRHEVQIMKELNHLNIIKYKPLPFSLEEELDKYNPTRLPLLSMEYCQKGNLRHVLTQPTNLCGLKEENIKDVLFDISDAVCYLHSRKITHRDIKPDNIVLHDYPERNEGTIYKLIDLGYAKELGDATVSFVGTLYYLAPEILANRKYDHSVDYWSLGVLAFEVICGVLPFSPFLSPVDRFFMIKNKGPDDISIYKSSTENFLYSSELFKENQISSCLKGHMEVWLRKALQFNPTLRSSPFPTSLNIFDQLKNILRKKILKVFSIYEYKYYSYEFDECTRLSTVQQWISRDTKISEKEQLLLGSVQFSMCDDQTLLAECLAEGKYEIFVFKRVALFNEDRHPVPRLVKQMFEKATEQFKWKDIKAIYSHAIHYIYRDVVYASAFSEAMDLYLKYMRTLVTKVQKNGEVSRQNVLVLLTKVKVFNTAIKGQMLSHKNSSLASRFLKLFSSLERCVHTEYFLAVDIAKWGIKVDAIKDMYSQLDIIKLPQLQELLTKAVHLLHITADKADKNNNISVVEMSKIVCSAMKLKDKLLCDKNLLEFVTYLGKALNHLESLITWINLFNSHIEKLSQSFTIMKTDLFELWQNSNVETLTSDQCPVLSDNKIESALTKSEMLNTRIEEIMYESLTNFKKFCDVILSHLSDTSPQL